MPHCIIEHANDLTDLVSPEEMMAVALQAMQASELFITEDIKVRTLDYAHYQRGGNRDNFIHVTLKILDGRTMLQKQNLVNLVITAMDNLPVFGVEITVEVREIESESHMKVNN